MSERTENTSPTNSLGLPRYDAMPGCDLFVAGEEETCWGTWRSAAYD